MSEIRDIKPAEPMWRKRPVEKTGEDAGREAPRKERKRRQRREDEGGGDDDGRGGTIDEYA